MKTYIISDIHNRTYWIEQFIKSLNGQYDEIVFLGDYFDNFGDDHRIAGESADWLAYSVSQPKRIHLYGNHDIWYRFPKIHAVRCSGNDEDKLEAIKYKLNINEWNSIKLCHFTQGWLLSHAGVVDKVFASKPFADKPLETTVPRVIELCNEALENLKAGVMSPILGCGAARFGRYPIGGITWCDWDDEFEPVEGINQIVGHTCGKNILKKTWIEATDNKRYIFKDNITHNHTRIVDDIIPHKILSKNYNIDTFNQYIGVLTDGEFSYISNPFIKPWDGK